MLFCGIAVGYIAAAGSIPFWVCFVLGLVGAALLALQRGRKEIIGVIVKNWEEANKDPYAETKLTEAMAEAGMIVVHGLKYEEGVAIFFDGTNYNPDAARQAFADAGYEVDDIEFDNLLRRVKS